MPGVPHLPTPPHKCHQYRHNSPPAQVGYAPPHRYSTPTAYVVRQVPPHPTVSEIACRLWGPDPPAGGPFESLNLSSDKSGDLSVFSALPAGSSGMRIVVLLTPPGAVPAASGGRSWGTFRRRLTLPPSRPAPCRLVRTPPRPPQPHACAPALPAHHPAFVVRRATTCAARFVEDRPPSQRRLR